MSPVLILGTVGNFKIWDLRDALPDFSDSYPNPLLCVCSMHFKSQGDGQVTTGKNPHTGRVKAGVRAGGLWGGGGQGRPVP